MNMRNRMKREHRLLESREARRERRRRHRDRLVLGSLGGTVRL